MNILYHLLISSLLLFYLLLCHGTFTKMLLSSQFVSLLFIRLFATSYFPYRRLAKRYALGDLENSITVFSCVTLSDASTPLEATCAW